MTALATAIALAGAILILIWLKNIGLPTDLGVVSSLPNSFVLATGLSFIGLPTVLALIVTALGAFVVGPPKQCRGIGNVRTRWPCKLRGQVLVWGLAALAFCALPLLVTIGGSGAAPWYVWFASVVIGWVVAGGLRFLWDPEERVRLKPIVATLPPIFVLGVFILGWAFVSAVNRGGFPSAHVCTTDGSRFAGFLISENLT